MNKIKKFFVKNIFFIMLLGFSVLIFSVNLRINFFRYNNFDYGKFDLGNMTQMLWNTLHGRLLYLTDYFGTNLPRWSMSHVDPILLLFVPVFWLFQGPLTLVVSQLILVIFSSILIYKIAYLKLKSSLAALIFGISFLVYPALGFVTAWTGFHGVSVVIPFFLWAFYVFEKAYESGKFSAKNKLLFWTLLVLTMAGKEQIPLYIMMYGIFVALFRSNFLESIKEKFLSKEWSNQFFSLPNVRLGISMFLVSFIWFILAFFVVIPHFAKHRVEGFEKFTQSLGIDDANTRDVALDNYFLARYDAFGDTYVEVALNMLLSPKKTVKVLFGGDRVDNLRRTFEPLGYLPLAAPQILIFAIPDFLINYGTSAGGIGTAEISNHRISMIIPVLFISAIYAVAYLSSRISFVAQRFGLSVPKVALILSLLVLVLNVVTSFKYNNPVYLWLTQAVGKRLTGLVFAKENIDIAAGDLEIGGVVKLSKLENKDRECAQKIVSMIPDGVSVSGPDYLGAHLSMRETYAIFPALFNEADYVVVDVFSRKILTILDVDLGLVRSVVKNLISNEDYKLVTGCGNLFVFKKVGPHGKSAIFPLQERYEYDEKVDLELFQSLYIVDYEIPGIVTRETSEEARIVYTRRANDSLDEYVMFVTLVNSDTGELYQAANLPSFGIKQPREWKRNRYYVENIEIVVPEFLDAGTYKFFIGMSNNIRTRSMYLGDVNIQ